MHCLVVFMDRMEPSYKTRVTFMRDKINEAPGILHHHSHSLVLALELLLVI